MTKDHDFTYDRKTDATPLEVKFRVDPTVGGVGNAQVEEVRKWLIQQISAAIEENIVGSSPIHPDGYFVSMRMYSGRGGGECPDE
jgi:hypothetical protein